MKIAISQFKNSVSMLNSRLRGTKQKITKLRERYEEIIQNGTQRNEEMEGRMKSCHFCFTGVL